MDQPCSPSPLLDLIEAHRRANVALCEAIDRYDEAREADPRPSRHFVLIPIRPGAAAEWSVFRDAPEEVIREELRPFRATAKAMPEGLRRAIEAEADRMEREALDAFARAETEFQAKHRARDLVGAETAWRAAMEAEAKALRTLCRHRPRDMAEVRTLAGYLASAEARDNFDDRAGLGVGLILLDALADTDGERLT